MNLKDKIEHTLKEKNIPHRFIPLPEDLPMDIAAHVAFHKIKMANAMATIVYKTEKGLVAALKRADTQIDEEKLKALAGVSTFVFGTKADLASVGAESGLVPYLGLDIPYFVDKKVLAVGTIYGTGGTKTVGMAMEAKDILAANHGTVGDFTVFEKSKEMLQKGRQRILSGITPSGEGTLHIGNYLGAVRQFKELAINNDCFLFVADLHALTTVQNKKQLQGNVQTQILNELALLGDLKNITFFRQSDVPMHTELQSILNNVTPLGLLKRAHAYKDKLAKDVMEDEINLGLFNYPILMAADILLYKPDLVPVGKDQKQHIEITRDIAERFNKAFTKKVFKLPEPHIPEEVAVILGTDGKRKMSKSLGNVISIFEDEAVVKKQVMSTYTDPTRAHATDHGHIEGNMVFTYLDHFPPYAKASGGRGEIEELKERYRQGKVSDVEVKEYLFESLMKFFGPARARYQELKNNPAKVKEILEAGAQRARSVGAQTMKEVREAVGLTNQYSFFDYNNRSDRFHKTDRTDMDVITIDQFAAVEVRVGKVVEASHPGKSEKLIRLVVNFGDQKRIIFTGVRPFGYTKDDFVGKQFLFVTNLAPRKMPSYVKTSAGEIVQEESQGMILAVDPPSHEASDGHSGLSKPIFISAEGMPLGAKIR